MAFQVFRAPEIWSSANRPLEFILGSERQPNTDPDESGIAIVSITQNDPVIVGNFGVNPADVIVFASTILMLEVGQYVLIENTALRLYSGTYRVTAVYGNGVFAIQSDYLGEDSGGEFSVWYQNYCIVFDVSVGEAQDTKRYYVKAGPDGRFVLNVQDQVQRSFGDVFGSVQPGLTTTNAFASTDRIATNYSIVAYDGYDVPDENGNSTFTVDLDSRQIIVTNFVGINAVHPYQHIQGGALKMDYANGFALYLISWQTPSTTAKFLTWGPREQTCGIADAFFLPFLHAGTAGEGMGVTVSTYNSAGAFIANTVILFSEGSPKLAGVVNVGPAALGNVITPDTAYYRMALVNFDETFISEVMRINVDRTCHEANERFYWLNKLGGIDQYTYTGRTTQVTTIERSVSQKPYMPRPVATPYYGDYQRRMYATMPDRRYISRTKPIGQDVTEWITQDLFESANVKMNRAGTWWTEVLLYSYEQQGTTTKGGNTILDTEYALGTDNITQRR